ncbi:16S rRNA pseudouridine(516) synthase [Shewanella sp. Choline-02u-19]|uniref:pseudouridine synthase n=1 Tax=unclassified Shewanella TaxID=196818 RepID=UPI000C32AD91|nr:MULTISPECIES: pseudouridine synthase [unclassified Shewanella]PKG55981.1 16S rRNA pseudouridine(516) synthase [Shewanella sp. GutDb-MelDb]PKG76597.1 16S rRNA pseudouridine(516) synthase [Shewanella sp. GutCb]PKH56229.1 16S rRNA pseudouridine(516) synthase [Shewanella sp. Bg11-22]PKI28701.1 16S rRNA pseudouridine(516) synthase [Shewanella sp. Choline-02u-19]
MESKRARLDRFISVKTSINRKHVRLLLAKGLVEVDGKVARDIDQIIDEFSHVCLEGEVLQANTPSYVMLHKPIGVVSATVDDKHKTVIDLLTQKDKHSLHIVGRLDLNTSGLLLLTNDGRWSKRLMSPEHKVAKLYRVTLENPLDVSYINAFAAGMYFEFEDITTLPAKLEIIDEYTALVSLMEGRYHQIKRMFGRFRNPVVGLHRISVGNIVLDSNLVPGQSRLLTAEEVSE